MQKSPIELLKDQRHARLEAAEFWLSTAENRHMLRDADRYRRVERDLDEAARLHALIRPSEDHPNDRIVPRLRAQLKRYAPAEAKNEHTISDADLKAAGLRPTPRRAHRSKAIRTRAFTCPPEKRKMLVELWGERCMIPGRSVRMSRPAGALTGA